MWLHNSCIFPPMLSPKQQKKRRIIPKSSAHLNSAYSGRPFLSSTNQAGPGDEIMCKHALRKEASASQRVPGTLSWQRLLSPGHSSQCSWYTSPWLFLSPTPPRHEKENRVEKSPSFSSFFHLLSSLSASGGSSCFHSEAFLTKPLGKVII